MAKTILVDGQPKEVLNTLRSGPDAPIHTYELRGGSYIQQVGAAWFIQERGQAKREVAVLDIPAKDRVLMVGQPNTTRALRSFLRYVEPVNNTPVGTTDRSLALRLDNKTAETIRFNLTARGYRVQVVFDDQHPVIQSRPTQVLQLDGVDADQEYGNDMDMMASDATHLMAGLCPGCSGRGAQLTDDPQVLKCQGCGGVFTNRAEPITMEQALKFVALNQNMLANAGADGQFYFDLDICTTWKNLPEVGRVHGWADTKTRRVVQFG